jgi:hypothetical protein
MLVIVNVSDKDAPGIGLNQYEVRINRNVIATFEHERGYNGAARCLRDAADAVEKCSKENQEAMLMELLPMFERMNRKEM